MVIRRSAKQIEALANPAQPAGAKRRARAIAAPSPVHGCRPDRMWVRPASEQVRPELDNHKLVDAIEWMHAQRGRDMTARDCETLAELEVRAWGWSEVQGLRTWSLPSWSDDLIPPRRSTGYTRFLALVLAAYRAGAVGVLLGYHECMALAGTKSRDTWRRWCVCMEAAGLVRIVQTWRDDPTETTRARCHGKLLYRLGPAWEAAAGPGLCENAAGGDGEVSATWAARMAHGKRQQARVARDERRASTWSTNENDPRFARKRDERTEPVLPAFRSSGSTPPVAMQGGQSAPPPCVVGTGDDLRASPSGATVATPPANAPAPLLALGRGTQRRQAPSVRRGRRRAGKPFGARASKIDREASQAAPSSPIGNVRPVSPEHVEREVAALLARAGSRDLPLQRGLAPPSTAQAADLRPRDDTDERKHTPLGDHPTVPTEPAAERGAGPQHEPTAYDSSQPGERRNDSRPAGDGQCFACAGRGFVGPWTCGECKGRGMIKRARPAPQRCRVCKGGGLDHSTGSVCKTCDGAGHE